MIWWFIGGVGLVVGLIGLAIYLFRKAMEASN